MRKQLHTIADIRAGHTFRGKIKNDLQGDIPVLQIRDIKDHTTLTTENLPRIKWQNLKEAATVRTDDILMPARGEYYKAAIMRGGEPAVATSQLFVLRLKTKEMMPEYLGWFLNQRTAQQYFLTHRSGTSIPMLNKQSLGMLEVSIPPLETQAKIVAIQECWEQEKQLTEQLLINREQMLNGIFQQLLEQ